MACDVKEEVDATTTGDLVEEHVTPPYALRECRVPVGPSGRSGLCANQSTPFPWGWEAGQGSPCACSGVRTRRAFQTRLRGWPACHGPGEGCPLHQKHVLVQGPVGALGTR